MISCLNRNALLMFQHQIRIKSAETAETAQTLASLEALRSENLLVPQLTSSEQWQTLVAPHATSASFTFIMAYSYSCRR